MRDAGVAERRPSVLTALERDAATSRGSTRRTFITLAAFASILAAVAVVLGTWTDEEYTLATTAHGLGYAWQRALHFELQAPLYFGIMALWREANSSVWFARLFSVLCATALFAALLPVGRRMAPGRDPLLFATFVACNPFVIWAALEVRLYAFALLISALLWLAFDSGFSRGNGRAARVAFVALGAIALYTQYFLGFLFIAYGITLVVEGRRRMLVPYVVALAAVGIAALPLFASLHSQVGVMSDLSNEPLSALLHDTLVHPWLDFVLPYDRAWDVFHVRGAYAALLVVLVVCTIYARPKFSSRFLGMAAAACAVEATYLVAVAVLKLGLQPRHFIALFFPLLVAAYGLVLGVARGRRPRIAAGLLGAYAVLTILVLFTNYAALAKNGDARRIGPYLAAHVAPGDAIAIFPADALPAYRRAYDGLTPLVPFPHALRTDRYDDAGLTLHSDAQAIGALRQLERDYPRIWLVVQGDCDPNRPFYGCDHVYAAVHDAHVRSDRHFYKGRVFELRP